MREEPQLAKHSLDPTHRVRLRKTDSAGNTIHNRILLALSRKECDLLFSKLELVEWKLRDVLHEPGERLAFGYFPNTAMASILTVMVDGKSVEVGLIGKEGFVGLPLTAGFRSSATQAVCQAPGTAFRVAADALTDTLRRCPGLARLLLRFSLHATMQVTQIAACNRLHEVHERLARWLLMSRDRLESDLLPLTQEFLSQMLGTRRASVSVAAAVLQKAGLIRYARGSVAILNRSGLQEASCECYDFITQQLESWQTESL